MIGVDTDAAGMREASQRAAAKATRGGLDNALFLAGTLEELPRAIDGSFSMIRATLPWGSLLTAALKAESAFVERLNQLLTPAGSFELMVSLQTRDQATGHDPLDHERMTDLAATYRALGFSCVEVRAVTQADVDASGSTWAKRLGIPRRRTAWLLRAERAE